jgi:hypothetical protein
MREVLPVDELHADNSILRGSDLRRHGGCALVSMVGIQTWNYRKYGREFNVSPRCLWCLLRSM